MSRSSTPPTYSLAGEDVIDLSADEVEPAPASVQQEADAELARALQRREYGQEADRDGGADEARTSGSNKRRRTEQADTSHSRAASALRSDLSASPPAAPSAECAFHVNHIRGVSNTYSLRLRSLVSGDIQRAVALNYCWDLAWLMDECPVLQTVPRVDCVAGEKYQHAEKGREELRQQAAALRLPNVHTHFARLPLPYSCHHTKLLLLAYPTGLRFIHSTANFLECDMSYKNQSMFVQDFPLKAAGDGAGESAWSSGWWLHDDFERSLCEYFSAYSSLELDVLPLLRQFDYRAARAILLPSAPGTYTGVQMARYGHMKVRAVLQRELTDTAGLATQPIVAQFSSLGSVTSKWLLELRRSLGATGQPLLSSEPPAIRLVWPTLADVRDSIEGWMAGGSLCCDSRKLNSTVRPLLHRWDGSATGRHQAAPHIKSYCRAQGQRAAYVIVTSANLSAAAWGALQKDGTQLAVRHYELGLLFTPSSLQHHFQAPGGLRDFSCTQLAQPSTAPTRDANSRVQLWLPSAKPAGLPPLEQSASQPSSSSPSSAPSSLQPVRRVLCPLPYSVTSARYGAADEPWRWDEDQPQPDRRGATFVAVGSR